MTQFDFFKYRNNRLMCEDVDIEEIAQKQGTPFYLYSHAALEQQYRRFDQAFSGVDHLICYSMKANSNAAILKTFFNLGGGVDVVSGGELRRAVMAGCDPKKIVFSGVGKTSKEIHLALNEGILQFNVESEQELTNIQRIASFLDKRAPIAIRVNPDVDPKTHPYISTGLKKNKFGVSQEKAIELYWQALSLSHVDVVGIDCHIGSQLTDLSPFGDALRKVREMVNFLKDQGVFLKHIDIGGGLGIRYNDEDAQSPEDYAAVVLKQIRDLGLKVILEPGRFLVGNSGALVTKVIYTKENDDGHKFTIIDAAFNDLMRPALYDAYHEINPVLKKVERKQITTDIVGPICETGDTFSKDRNLQATVPGEHLAIMSAGAYGMSMASTYNTRGRCAEVMVKEKQFFVIKKPDRLEDIFGKESLPEFLKDRS